MTSLRPRRHLGALAQTTASAVVVVGTALPWVHSGARDIDLYEMRRVAYRLEADVNLRLVDLVTLIPLVLAAALLARWAGHRLVGWLLSLAVAVYAGVGALLMIRSSLPTGAGVVVTALGAIALVAVVGIEWIGGHLRSVSPADGHAPDVTTAQDPQGSTRQR